ncbi:ATP-grasp domain-containing protein [Streptomyces sp. SD31]|uniref:ATP-grasp domain-containing protein n=1 Tax=Streptomyces sp. SD31 TaxID=3452208 RepID=UPI003F8CEF7D
MSHLVFLESTPLGNHALAYARDKGHRTTLLRSPRYDFFLTPEVRARAASLADQVVEVDDLSDVDAVRQAMQSADVPHFDAVLTVVQFCVTSAAHLARACGVRGPSPTAVEAAKDKSRCRQILDEHAIPNLRHFVVTSRGEALEAADALGYPVVIKPVSGTGKLVTTMARGERDITLHFAEVAARRDALESALTDDIGENFIVEEVAVGPLYSVEVATDGRSTVPLAAIRRKVGRDNPLLELGSTMPTGLPGPEEDELGAYCVRVCQALGLDLGIFHVEAIHTVEGFRLIEVNPRIGGGMVPDVIRAATDTNLFEILVDLYAGSPAPARPLAVRRGATNYFLGVERPRTVRADLPEDWFEGFRPRLEFGSSTIRAGMQLRAMEGNLDRYGTLQVTAQDSAQAERDCADIAAAMESVLGIDFVATAPGP